MKPHALSQCNFKRGIIHFSAIHFLRKNPMLFNPIRERVSLDTWEVFLYAAQRNSFLETARELHLDPATVSRHIKNLEDKLGVQLFYRESNGAYLTVAGQSLLNRAQPIVKAWLTLRDYYDTQHLDIKGKLRIILPSVLACDTILRRIGYIEWQNPGLHIELDIRDDNIAFTQDSGPCLQINLTPNTYAHKSVLGRLSIVHCASTSYIHGMGYPNTPEELLTHTLLRSERMYTLRRLSLYQKNEHVSVPLSRAKTLNRTRQVIEAVRAGNGIGIGIPKILIQDLLRQKELVPILEKWNTPPIQVYASYARKYREDPRIKLIIDRLKPIFLPQ